jgi:hypothetical protein
MQYFEDSNPTPNAEIGCKMPFLDGHKQKHRALINGIGAFKSIARPSLFALSTLMSRASQQLAVFMLTHFLSAFFNDAAQWITSFPKQDRSR